MQEATLPIYAKKKVQQKGAYGLCFFFNQQTSIPSIRHFQKGHAMNVMILYLEISLAMLRDEPPVQQCNMNEGHITIGVLGSERRRSCHITFVVTYFHYNLPYKVKKENGFKTPSDIESLHISGIAVKRQWLLSRGYGSKRNVVVCKVDNIGIDVVKVFFNVG